MKITVYCGATSARDPELEEQVREFGSRIAGAGDSLVFGGSDAGLMATLSDAVLDAGGYVTGVEFGCFDEMHITHEGLSELIVEETLSGRKQKMIDLGDAFVALPGGSGTLDEISEVIELKSIRLLDKPCILFNWKGYYEPLIAWFDHMRTEGFMKRDIRELVSLAGSAEEIMRLIHDEADRKR